MSQLTRYDSFQELKQAQTTEIDMPLALQRHEEMEKFLRQLREKWLQQKMLKKQRSDKKTHSDD